MTAQIETVDFFAFDNSYARLPDRLKSWPTFTSGPSGLFYDLSPAAHSDRSAYYRLRLEHHFGGSQLIINQCQA